MAIKENSRNIKLLNNFSQTFYSLKQLTSDLYITGVLSSYWYPHRLWRPCLPEPSGQGDHGEDREAVRAPVVQEHGYHRQQRHQ